MLWHNFKARTNVFYILSCVFSLSIFLSDPDNKAHLEEIQGSIFALCLDGKVARKSSSNQETINAQAMNHGGGSDYNSANRWFDKTLQVS